MHTAQRIQGRLVQAEEILWLRRWIDLHPHWSRKRLAREFCLRWQWLDGWRFEGFLPRRGADRARRLGEIAVAPHPSVIYESPQRISSTLHDLANCCGGDRRVAVCRELTKLFEETWRGTLDEACERDAAGAARGEHVLVVAAATAGERAAPSEGEVESAVAS